VSTLNEMAANHAKMAKTLARESTPMGERRSLIVGGFAVSPVDEPPHMPLHQVAGVQDMPLGQATGYAL
jgi:hypothetical protein